MQEHAALAELHQLCTLPELQLLMTAGLQPPQDRFQSDSHGTNTGPG